MALPQFTDKQITAKPENKSDAGIKLKCLELATEIKKDAAINNQNKMTSDTLELAKIFYEWVTTTK